MKTKKTIARLVLVLAAFMVLAFALSVLHQVVGSWIEASELLALVFGITGAVIGGLHLLDWAFSNAFKDGQ